MNIINIRTPFVINIGDYGLTQTGSKVTLSIWQKGNTPPISGQTGFYTLTKSIVSATQRATYYNISNYVKEFINTIEPQYVGITTVENFDTWVYVDVTTYWTTSSGQTQISIFNYQCINGYNAYGDGKNYGQNYTLRALLNPTQIRQIPFQSVSSNGTYMNVMASFANYGDRLDAEYNAVDLITGVPYSITISIVNGGEPRTTYNKCVPLSLMPFYNYPSATTIVLKWYASGSSTPSFLTTIRTQVVEECKYTPVKCAFINRYGGWEFLNFFKAQTNSISVKGTDYKFTQDAFNYNPKIGQFKTMNINGRQTVKLNTGWVDEDYSDLIQDLLLSETILLDNQPALVKTQSSDFKTNLKDKNINYEIEFDYAFNLINDVI